MAAPVISLAVSTPDLTANTFTVTDNSTYVTPARSGYGVFTKTYKVNYDGTRNTLTNTSNNSNPVTDSIWTVSFTTDGWYQTFYVAPLNYSGATTYAKYDAVFDPTGKLVYISQQAANTGNALTNTAFWQPVADPTQLALNVGATNQSNNLASSLSSVILYPLTSVNFGTQTGIAFLEPTTTAKRSADVRLYELLGLAVDSMFRANATAQWTAGEIFARKATSINVNSSSLV